MANTSKIVIIICGYIWLTDEANRKTLYEISSPEHVFSLASCGIEASGFDYCAARVTNNTCEPLDRDWCKTEDMSEEGVYITKTKVIEILQETRGDTYRRQMPIVLDEGCEVEFKFTLHSGWSSVGIDLNGDPGNIGIHTKLASKGRFIIHSMINGKWSVGWGGYQKGYRFPVDVEYTYRIMCGSSSFSVYMNDTFVGSIVYVLPVNKIRNVVIYQSGTPTDLHQATYSKGY